LDNLSILGTSGSDQGVVVLTQRTNSDFGGSVSVGQVDLTVLVFVSWLAISETGLNGGSSFVESWGADLASRSLLGLAVDSNGGDLVIVTVRY